MTATGIMEPEVWKEAAAPAGGCEPAAFPIAPRLEFGLRVRGTVPQAATSFGRLFLPVGKVILAAFLWGLLVGVLLWPIYMVSLR